jgi:hypothetical protein
MTVVLMGSNVRIDEEKGEVSRFNGGFANGGPIDFAQRKLRDKRIQHLLYRVGHNRKNALNE